MLFSIKRNHIYSILPSPKKIITIVLLWDYPKYTYVGLAFLLRFPLKTVKLVPALTKYTNEFQEGYSIIRIKFTGKGMLFERIFYPTSLW